MNQQVPLWVPTVLALWASAAGVVIIMWLNTRKLSAKIEELRAELNAASTELRAELHADFVQIRKQR